MLSDRELLVRLLQHFYISSYSKAPEEGVTWSYQEDTPLSSIDPPLNKDLMIFIKENNVQSI